VLITDFGGDYALHSPQKAAHIIKTLANKFISNNRTRTKTIEASVHTYIRQWVAPTIQRIAQFQRYEQCSSDLLNKPEVLVLYKELKENQAAADKELREEGQVDYAATSR
jgi:hypothetical protein